ncbi:MAG: type II toxin-antitoxin system RelE/ParE family toxin [Tepidisphaeraceae bacterium]
MAGGEGGNPKQAPVMRPALEPRPIIVRPEAEADIVEAATWYHNQQPGLGDDFLGEVENAITLIAENPFRFPCLRRRPEVRRALTQRFPYRVFFIRRPEMVIVFRVLHSSMQERNWTATLGEVPS